MKTVTIVTFNTITTLAIIAQIQAFLRPMGVHLVPDLNDRRVLRWQAVDESGVPCTLTHQTTRLGISSLPSVIRVQDEEIE